MVSDRLKGMDSLFGLSSLFTSHPLLFPLVFNKALLSYIFLVSLTIFLKEKTVEFLIWKTILFIKQVKEYTSGKCTMAFSVSLVAWSLLVCCLSLLWHVFDTSF